MATILGYVTTFVTSLLSVGTSIITWITAEGHEIALIPVVMMICIFFVSSVRKMIKGV